MDIFLSYAWGPGNSLKPFAAEVVAGLRGAGYSVWWDADHMPAQAAAHGGNLDDAMATAIVPVRAVVALISPAYASSESCKTELTLARDYGKPILYVNVGHAGYTPKSYDHKDPAALAVHGWLHAKVKDALWTDAREVTPATWHAPGGGGAMLLAALAATPGIIACERTITASSCSSSSGGSNGCDNSDGCSSVGMSSKRSESTSPEGAPQAASAAAAAAPQQQEYIYACSASAAYSFGGAAKGAYKSLLPEGAAGPVGLAIVGLGTSYSLLLYDGARTTLAMAAVGGGAKFEPQTGGKGLYVTFAPSGGVELSYSFALATPAAATELLRNLAAAAAHAALHGSSSSSGVAGFAPVTVCSPAREAGPSRDSPAAPGDAATLRYTLHPATTLPSARPTDMLKAPPCARDCVRRVLVGAARGLGALVAGARLGDRRVALVPMGDLFALGEVEASELSGSANALAMAGGGLTCLVDVTMEGLEETAGKGLESAGRN